MPMKRVAGQDYGAADMYVLACVMREAIGGIVCIGWFRVAKPQDVGCVGMAVPESHRNDVRRRTQAKNLKAD
jgi:hypothetical protein